MATVTIYGASDDLIELDGDLSEEFSALNDYREETGGLLGFSDGTVLDVIYGHEGIWRIVRVSAGTATFTKDENPLDDDERYSDRVTLEGDLRWCVFGQTLVRAKTTA